MASLRARHRRDGSEYFAVLYRMNGRQSSSSFHDFSSAARFRDAVNKFGPENALATLNHAGRESPAVEHWVAHYIDHLTGVEPETVKKYHAYLVNDIAPHLGPIPLAGLTGDHVRMWLKDMGEPDEDGRQTSAKTIRNKHGLLAAALNAAVPRHIPANPCTGIRLPRWVRPEMVFLTPAHFDRLLGAVTAPWRPLVEFLVTSGCRWGEATALRPGDVNRDEGTVNIVRAWKSGAGEYRLGPPKTPKSVRMINIPASTRRYPRRSSAPAWPWNGSSTATR